MATFKPHYTLCPLLGANNLVGIASDKENGTVLVTLGPNIVVKHKLTDQKPIKSWSTRQSNPLTCQCVYDAQRDKYVGVISHKHLCEWSDDQSNLEDIKKKTFSTDIHAIHTLPGKPAIVVFQNGYIEYLESAIENRKVEKPRLIQGDEALIKSFLECVKEQIILVLFTDTNKVYYVRLRNDGTPEGNFSFCLQKASDDLKALGKTVISDGQNINIFVLWSSGELSQYSEQGTPINSHKVSGISFTSPLALVKLDSTHLAVYGADSSDEGALLLLFDLKFGMNVATRRLKFYCNPPILYCLPDNNVVLLCIVQNLVVVPYVLQPSLLWNLINKKQTTDVKIEPELVNWSQEGKLPSNSAVSNPLTFRKAELTRLASSLWHSNASCSRLYDELLPLLKEDGDLDGICLLLRHLKDLPEKWHADILNYMLEQPQFNQEDGMMSSKESSQLAVLLSIPYSDVVLLNHLRKKLTTKSTIRLLKHLSMLLQECQWIQQQEVQDEPIGPYVSQIVDWISMILDAHHNELLVAGTDEQVKDIIDRLKEQVAKRYEFLDCLGQSEALIQLLQRSKNPPTNQRKDWYAIEVVRLL